MKILVVAVGQKMPDWAQAASDDYFKRFPADWKVEIKTVKTEPRTSGKTAPVLMAAERARIEAAISTGARHPYVIALDEHGVRQTTVQLAQSLQSIDRQGHEAVLLIGGPDGLDAGLKKQAQALWRLSDLTLPHAMVRVLLAEQLYRAWSILAGHPYHRE
ncbi:23S rRNA (pseudouridine(1915)-N(3))-methyltransferase RlmH [Saezia sanguinis]|uniref:23S rRNA (pseudouridine(1915)-N(3))-methyltransferase RlmH n=1 Tax=Saezia sanguinis TaxID=1965230 RepID=UPI003045C42C